MPPIAVTTTGCRPSLQIALLVWAFATLASGGATLTRGQAKAPDLHSLLFKGSSDAAIIREKQIWEQDMAM